MTALRLKRIGWILLAAAGLIVAVALMIPRLLDTEAARRAIADFLETRLGREVVIGGRLRLTLIPHMGFVIEDLRIAEAGGFGQGEAARLQTVEVALEPLPLLHRRLVLESIRIQSPRLRLVRGAGGKTNWDRPETGGCGPSVGLAGGDARELLEFKQLRIEDGELDFSDVESQTHLRFYAIDLLRRGTADPAFSLSVEATCAGAAISGCDRFAVRLRGSGQSRGSLNDRLLAVKEVDLNIDFLHRATSGSPVPVARLSGELSAAWPEGRFRLERLLLSTPGASLRGRLEGLLKETWSVAGPLRIEIEDLKRVTATLGGEPPAFLEKWPSRADFAVDLSAAGGTLTLDRIQGKLGEQPINGRLTLSAREPALISAVLATGDIDLDQFMAPGEPSPPSEPPLRWLLDPPVGVDLSLEAASIAWRGERFASPRVEIQGSAKSGWDLSSATAVWNDAPLSIRGRLRPEGRMVRTKLHIAAQGVESGRIWKLAGARGQEPGGPLDLDIHLLSHGADWAALEHNISASASITTRGALRIGGREHPAIRGTLHAETGPLGALQMTSEVDISQPALHGRLALEGTWDAKRPGLEDARLRMTFESSDLPEAQRQFDLEGSLSALTAEPRLDYRVERFSAFGLQGQARLRWPVAGDFKKVQARLDVPPFDARPWLALMGLVMPAEAGTEVWQRLGVSASLDLDPTHLAIRDLALILDDTTVRGVLDLTDGPALQVRFMLDADGIDLDRYRLSARPGGASDQDPASSIARRIDAQGALTLGRLHLLGCDAHDISARIRTAEGRLHLDSLSAAFYQGRIDASAMLALDGSDPAWHLQSSLHQVAIQDPLQRIFNAPVLSGLADIQVQLAARRRDDAASRVAGLDGQIDWVLCQGAIHGICIVPQRQPEPAGAGAGDFCSAPGDPQQAFEEIRGSWKITDGVATTQSHRLTAENLFMAAAGRVDLVRERLDATLAVDIQGMPTVYYSLAGPFDGIQVEMDRSRLMIDGANQIVGAPLDLGRGILSSGAEILEQGRQTIGDDTGLQRMGQGALGTGKGVLRLGQGALEIGKGTEKIEEGLRDLGQGALDLGNGALGLGTDTVKVFEGVGRGLGRLFGGGDGQTD